jgi:hypothetical protein
MTWSRVRRVDCLEPELHAPSGPFMCLASVGSASWLTHSIRPRPAIRAALGNFLIVDACWPRLIRGVTGCGRSTALRAVGGEVLASEKLTECLFLRNDLHDGDDNRKQRGNQSGTRAAEPDRPPDEQQHQSQIHRIAADAKNTVRHKV